MPDQRETVEERLDAIEALIDRVIAYARKHPFGRQILTMLGLS